MNAQQTGNVKRILALDGLRGLAILLVFVGHVALFGSSESERLNPIVGFFARNNGVGVDLFFVLSGFLITGILEDTKRSPFYFRQFYARRTLRIFPLYYAVLVVITVARLQLPHIYALRTISAAALVADWTYTSNFLMAVRGWGAEPLFLGHFWSLAVEEQFYLIWPVIVLRLPRAHLLKVCAVGVAVAFVVRVVLIQNVSYESAYVLLPARMDALLVGASIALWSRGNGTPSWVESRVFGILAGVAFLLAVLMNNVPIPGAAGLIRAAGHFSITSVAFGLLVIGAKSAPERLIPRIFTVRPMRFLGKYSYAIYVFHLAVIVAAPAFIRYVSVHLIGHSVKPNLLEFGLIVAAMTVVLALMSWWLIERPFLRLKDRLRFGETP